MVQQNLFNWRFNCRFNWQLKLIEECATHPKCIRNKNKWSNEEDIFVWISEQALLRYEKADPPYPSQQFYNDLSYTSYMDYSYSNPVDLTWTPYDHEGPQDFSTRPHTNCNQKIYRGRGRPAGTRKEKMEKMSDEEYVHQPDSTSGKLQGCEWSFFSVYLYIRYFQ